MVHVVTDLRTSLRAALVLAMPTIKWAARRRKSDTSRLARGIVYTPVVQTDRFTDDEVGRTVEVVVEVKREGDDTLDDVLDEDAAQIEKAVLPVLDGLSHDSDLVETDTEVDSSAKVPVGYLKMQFRVVLLTDYGAPDV